MVKLYIYRPRMCTVVLHKPALLKPSLHILQSCIPILADLFFFSQLFQIVNFFMFLTLGPFKLCPMNLLKALPFKIWNYMNLPGAEQNET